MKRVVFVLSGGVLGEPAFLRERAATLVPVATVCADCGARHLGEGWPGPVTIVGDMDSLPPGRLAGYAARGFRILRHPKRKDETDTELALEEAFALLPDEVWIWAALGRRVDHALANIALLAKGVARGVDVRLVDQWCELFLVDGRRVIDGEAGQTVSLFPYAGPATGVTLSGFEYPLADAPLAVDSPRGVSNRLVAKRGVVEVRSGRLLVVRYFRPGAFPGEEEG